MWTASDFSVGEFARSKLPPPPQTGLMTTKKLEALIRAGYGQGHFQRYKPWLRVTKRDSSPVSFVGHLPSPEFARLHHFRAIAERRTIQLACWLGAKDVREQYPMWPWAHQHPAVGLEGVEDLAPVRGLIEIAAEARIRHGNFPGTRLPYIGTIDILTTWKRHDGSWLLIALDNKPEETVLAPKIVSRAKERLELARRYCAECQIRHLIVHAELLPHELATNIDALAPTTTMRSLITPLYGEVVESLKEHGYTQSPQTILNRIASRRSCSLYELQRYFHLALWRLDVDHDLTRPFDPAEPLQKGGIAFRQQLRSAWLGADA